MSDYEKQVGDRLRAIMQAFGISTNPKMASICDTTPSAVNNWLLGNNLPRVPEMIRLCERTGVTLDWIYRGSTSSIEPGKAKALNLIAHQRESLNDGERVRSV